MESVLRIKNWSKHQHFKDRTPPWIKLYRDILDDPDWHDLEPALAKTLVSLWLIASEDETHTGTLPDSRKLAFRLRITVKQLNTQLVGLSHWLIQDDINSISGNHQPDAPEERRGETEKEGEGEVGGAKAPLLSAVPPACPHLEILELFAKHLPELPQSKPELWSGAREAALKARWKWLLITKKTNGERYAETREEGLAWFDRYFAYVAHSDFLTGRSGKFQSCDLGWLVNGENFAKVLQGNYDNPKKVAA